MRAGDKYFVRVDRKISERQVDRETFEAHISYLKRLASKTELYAGGFKDAPGGMIVFRAKGLDDADAMCEGDPVVAGGFYDYVLHEWDLLLTSR